MHYVGLALYAEGPTDYRFLCPVLRRTCLDICLQRASAPVEVSDVLELSEPRMLAGASRAERIERAARDAASSWSVLFVHADADSDARRAHDERVAPALSRLRDLDGRRDQVAVIPVRMTEAWALCDGDGLRAVLGSTLDDDALGLPTRAAAVESVLDPKGLLDEAVRVARPSGRRLRSFDLLSVIGERISLERLRYVPSFGRMEGALEVALERMNVFGAARASP